LLRHGVQLSYLVPVPYWQEIKFALRGILFNKSAILPSAMEKVVREQRVLYGKHMDITSYDGKRETHNPAGITLERFLVYIFSLTRYRYQI
jgi:hypothetical protein